MPSFAVAEGEELEESLLQDEAEFSAPVFRAQQQAPQQQVILYQPFSLEAFIRCVVQSWLSLLSKYRSKMISMQAKAQVAAV